MQLIGYKHYQKGFFGCLEDEHRYVCFLFSKNTFRAVTTYAKEDFTCHDHFMATMHKFLPHHFFLRQPVPVASLEAHDLALADRRLMHAARGAAAMDPHDRALAGGR